IIADDLRADDLGAMPAARALLAAQGTSFTQCLTPAPGCAPARASLLRGQYPHNHGVLRGNGRFGGFERFRERGNEASTLATWLHDAGYRTALVGKYLNAYPTGAAPDHIPPAWDEWAAATKGGYTGFELNENGTLTRYRKRDGDYQTDVLAQKARDFVSRAAQGEQPFFLYLAPRAPHGPATPAPRHAGMFAEAPLPRPPSFSACGKSGKPRWLQEADPLGEHDIATIEEMYRKRLATLQALDELVASIVTTLEATGTLPNTHIMFTSDHGYHLGEHRIPEGKGTPYEEAIRIPLVVRGPGVPAGRSAAVVSTVDLAPTIAALAGAAIPAFVDGRSLLPVLQPEPAPWRQSVLVAHHHNRPTRTDGPPAFSALRADDLTYVEYADGSRELYNLEADPHQLDNRLTALETAEAAQLATRLAELRACAANTCRTAEDAPLVIEGRR
ncbi:MAG: sulfatase, partial [Thermomicrobiales bacterium]|nr:sulfatase [Thermomicrobiales bacterium]